MSDKVKAFLHGLVSAVVSAVVAYFTTHIGG